MSTTTTIHPTVSTWSGPILRRAIGDSLRKLAPQVQWRNPVMFVVYVGSVLTTALGVWSLFTRQTMLGGETAIFVLAISLWLWFTVLFANFAESVAEGRGKAQAQALRGAKKETPANKLAEPRPDSRITSVPSSTLRAGDFVLVRANEVIPGDGDVINGAASVDESAITGESAPVVR